MRRLLAWLAGGLGVAALLRALRRRDVSLPQPPDPAEELRAKLAEARRAGDDRDDFDAAEGVAVDAAEEPRSLEERRQAVHDKAQEALGLMRADDDD
jgi:hypothetical protein